MVLITYFCLTIVPSSGVVRVGGGGGGGGGGGAWGWGGGGGGGGHATLFVPPCALQ